MKVLMVLTSHDQLGDTGHKTGFWLEEFTSPYYVFKDAGAEITLASPAGGQPPLDPNSDSDDAQTESTQRFKDDKNAQNQLANTQVLSQVDPDEFDAVFYPGGHGPLWDLAENTASQSIIEKFYQANKPVGAVCHAPAVFKNTKNATGQALVHGKKVTSFSNSEEAAVELTEVIPFLVEDMLKDQGGKYTKGNDWESFVQIDGNLITGQNPASSAETAKAVLAQLN